MKFSQWWSRRDQLAILDKSLQVLAGTPALSSVLHDLTGYDYANYSSAVTTIEAGAYYKEKFGNIILHPPGPGFRKPDFKVSTKENEVYFECKSPQLSNIEKQIQQIIYKTVAEIPDLSSNISSIVLDSLGLGSNKKNPQLPPDRAGVYIIDLRYSLVKTHSDVEMAFLPPKGIFTLSGAKHISAAVSIENDWANREVIRNTQGAFPLEKSIF